MQASWMELVTQASLFVQAIMFCLFLLSILSWTLIVQRNSALKSYQETLKESQRLLEKHPEVFWERIQRKPEHLAERLALEAYRYAHMPNMDSNWSDIQQRCQMAWMQKRTEIEEHLSTLATIGVMSPYIGLLGTVWGIMTSIRGMSDATQATLAAVAPGIAEALIATAMGLLVAIPASFAYNRYAQRVQQLALQYEGWMEALFYALKYRTSQGRAA